MNDTYNYLDNGHSERFGAGILRNYKYNVQNYN